MQRAVVGVFLMILPLAPVVPAQSPSFEVASIKPNRSPDFAASFANTPDV